MQVAEQNLGLHSEYLAAQLDTASRLVSLIESGAEDGGPDEGVTRGVEAIKDHGLAVGHAHERANEVLRDLVALELGATPDTITATAERADVTAPPADGMTITVDDTRPALTGSAPAPAAAQPGQDTGTAPTTADSAAPAAKPTDRAAQDSAPTDSAATATAPAAGAATTDVSTDSPATDGAAPAAKADAAETDASKADTAKSDADTAAADGAASNGGAELDVETARATLVELVAEKTGYPADMLEPDMDVEADLGIDSIKRLQIMGALRDRFPQLPEIGPESMAELRTLDDIAGLIANGPNGSAASNGSGGSDGSDDTAEQAADAEGKVGA